MGLFWREKKINTPFCSFSLYMNINLNISYPSYPYVDVNPNAVLARVRSMGDRSANCPTRRPLYTPLLALVPVVPIPGIAEAFIQLITLRRCMYQALKNVVHLC
jgi:hypothetical protein